MASSEIHLQKYLMFRKDSENESSSHPTRIGAVFEAMFHLIEFCVAKHRLHINKHQMLRQVLEDNQHVFEEDTNSVWTAFQRIENQIRPGQAYGGAIDGEQFKLAKELLDGVEIICKKRGYLAEGI